MINMQDQKKADLDLETEIQIELKSVIEVINFLYSSWKNGEKRCCWENLCFCLRACQLSSLPSSIFATTALITAFQVRHLLPAFLSLHLETQRLASKRALDRIHQPDQHPLENASSALLPSVLLAIIFIQPQMTFSLDHRTCTKYVATPY